MSFHSRAKWNADLKTTKNARTGGDLIGTGANWKQNDRNRKAEERAARKAAKKARRK